VSRPVPALLLGLLLGLPACSTPPRASLGGLVVQGRLAGPVSAAGAFLADSHHLRRLLAGPVRLDGLRATLETSTGTSSVWTTAFGPAGSGAVRVDLVEAARRTWSVQGATLVLGESSFDLLTGSAIADPGP
jgi:hypothetical protein